MQAENDYQGSEHLIQSEIVLLNSVGRVLSMCSQLMLVYCTSVCALLLHAGDWLAIVIVTLPGLLIWYSGSYCQRLKFSNKNKK